MTNKIKKMIHNLNRNQFQFFPYHLVSPSPWPILLSFSLFSMAIGAVMYMHGYVNGGNLLTTGFILTAYGMGLWFRDVVTEGTYLGDHTKQVKKGIQMGVILFIVSEIFAFLSVFWAFFHASLSPSIEIGGVWPPQGITPLDPFAIPLLNTILLVSSGAFVTYGHHALVNGNRRGSIIGMFLTILFAVIFTVLQYVEYSEAAFTMSDSVYGSAFYASTGLHGLTLSVPTKLNKFCPTVKKENSVTKFERRILKTISTLSKNSFSAFGFAEQKDKLLIKFSPFGQKIKTFYLEPDFLEWLVGFTDAEGNFNISLRNLINDKYNSLILTFQIGLHIDDLNLLKIIKEKLNCGHISISGSRCNYFVNDQVSLINVILPIFNFFKLNSSKYYQYLIFEKAIKLIKNKNLYNNIKIDNYSKLIVKYNYFSGCQFNTKLKENNVLYSNVSIIKIINKKIKINSLIDLNKNNKIINNISTKKFFKILKFKYQSKIKSLIYNKKNFVILNDIKIAKQIIIKIENTLNKNIPVIFFVKHIYTDISKYIEMNNDKIKNRLSVFLKDQDQNLMSTFAFLLTKDNRGKKNFNLLHFNHETGYIINNINIKTHLNDKEDLIKNDLNKNKIKFDENFKLTSFI